MTSQGRSVAEAIRSIGISEVTYYRWRAPDGPRAQLTITLQKSERTEAMFQTRLAQRATALISAVICGYGVFCVIYSFTPPEVAGRALVLVGIRAHFRLFQPPQIAAVMQFRTRSNPQVLAERANCCSSRSIIPIGV
jgi:hypothetical protein